MHFDRLEVIQDVALVNVVTAIGHIEDIWRLPVLGEAPALRDRLRKFDQALEFQVLIVFETYYLTSRDFARLAGRRTPCPGPHRTLCPLRNTCR